MAADRLVGLCWGGRSFYWKKKNWSCFPPNASRSSHLPTHTTLCSLSKQIKAKMRGKKKNQKILSPPPQIIKIKTNKRSIRKKFKTNQKGTQCSQNTTVLNLFCVGQLPAGTWSVADAGFPSASRYLTADSFFIVKEVGTGVTKTLKTQLSYINMFLF